MLFFSYKYITWLTLQPTLSVSLYLTLTYTTSPVRHHYIYLVWSCALARWSSGKKMMTSARYRVCAMLKSSTFMSSSPKQNKRSLNEWWDHVRGKNSHSVDFLDERVYCAYMRVLMECVVVTCEVHYHRCPIRVREGHADWWWYVRWTVYSNVSVSYKTRMELLLESMPDRIDQQDKELLTLLHVLLF